MISFVVLFSVSNFRPRKTPDFDSKTAQSDPSFHSSNLMTSLVWGSASDLAVRAMAGILTLESGGGLSDVGCLGRKQLVFFFFYCKTVVLSRRRRSFSCPVLAKSEPWRWTSNLLQIRKNDQHYVLLRLFLQILLFGLNKILRLSSGFEFICFAVWSRWFPSCIFCSKIHLEMSVFWIEDGANFIVSVTHSFPMKGECKKTFFLHKISTMEFVKKLFCVSKWSN